MRAALILRLARARRCAIAGSVTRKDLATSVVDRPPSSRRVSATCASLLSAWASAPSFSPASRPSENGFPDASGRRRSTASVAARPAGSWPSFPGATAFVRPHGDLDSVAGIELAHEAGEVRFDGAEADVQLVGDLVVGPPMGHGDEDLLFPARERFPVLCQRLPRMGVGVGGEKARAAAPCDECVAVGGGVDRLGEQFGAGVLEQETAGAR